MTTEEIVEKLYANFAKSSDYPSMKTYAAKGLTIKNSFCFPILNTVSEDDPNSYCKIIHIQQACDVIEKMDLDIDAKEIKKEVDRYVEESKIDPDKDLYMTMIRVHGDDPEK